MPGIALSHSQPPEMEPMEAESPALEAKPEPPAKPAPAKHKGQKPAAQESAEPEAS